MKKFLAVLVLCVLSLPGLALLPVQVQTEPLKVFGAYATPIEEGWDGVDSGSVD